MPETLEGALAGALVGEELGLTSGDVLGQLATRGWPPEAIAAHAAAVLAAGDVWPHPVPQAAVTFGAARWSAAVAALVHELGLDVDPQPPSHRTALNADERRLLADKPPHYA